MLKGKAFCLFVRFGSVNCVEDSEQRSNGNVVCDADAENIFSVGLFKLNIRNSLRIRTRGYGVLTVGKELVVVDSNAL